MAFSIIYSILIEIIQGNWCINRSFDLFDILANSIGAIAASLLIEFKFKNTRLFAINKT
jgi:glycopeptide antibiotics resistance protein